MCAFSQSESGKYFEWIIIYCKGLGAWNEPWYRCPWRNIRFITWIDLVSSIQSLVRMLNHAALCYSCTCISLKNYREISHGWIFCFLSCETRFSTRFLIACSWFAQELRIANRVKNRDSQRTVNILLNGTVIDRRQSKERGILITMISSTKIILFQWKYWQESLEE